MYLKCESFWNFSKSNIIMSNPLSVTSNYHLMPFRLASTDSYNKYDSVVKKGYWPTSRSLSNGTFSCTVRKLPAGLGIIKFIPSKIILIHIYKFIHSLHIYKGIIICSGLFWYIVIIRTESWREGLKKKQHVLFLFEE